ncbi:hypothetical protein MAR_028037, partial [Mya arenaria]
MIESSEYHLTKQYCSKEDFSPCYLTHNDLKESNVGMGANISCAVRAFNEPGGQPGQLSAFSRPYFVGITVLTPSLTLRRGETKAIEFELSIPVVCDHPPGLPCKLTLDYFTPDYGTCP